MTSLPHSLEDQAEAFASEITQLLRSTVSDDAEIRSVRLEGPSKSFIVGNRLPENRTEHEEAIRTLRGEPIPTGSGIDLRANWRFVPNSSGQYLKTAWSQFGLYVNNAPFTRLEVDPSKEGGHDAWLAAHIQVTGESGYLGFLLGSRGLKLRRLQNLHLPVGGFRYRPCLEDFIEFAIDEDLILGKDGWNETLNETRERYRVKQLHTLVYRYPEVSREALAAYDARAVEGGGDSGTT